MYRRSPRDWKGLTDFIEYIGDVSDLTILEVGSWAGCSARIFADDFKRVICVDPWKPTIGTFTETDNIVEAENTFNSIMIEYDNIIKIKDRIENIDFEKVDVIYIDGNHNYDAVKRDIRICLPKCKLFLGGHDYDRPEVRKAVDESLGKPDRVFMDNSWIKKMKE